MPHPAPVLERDEELATLGAAVRAAAAGEGSLALVHGEAGIGKTSVVSALPIPREGRLLVGHCDHLSTPRVLGPFRDLADSVGIELARALREAADPDRLYTALLAELDRPGRATVLVVEDVHWADEATLDALRVLARRLDGLPVLVILTYRDDELHHDHPLTDLLSVIAGGPMVHRLSLAPLSLAAVARLSQGSGLDPEALHMLTGGNPFFLHEVRTNATGVPPERPPANVVDTVRARLRALGPTCRAAVEALSVITTAVPRALVDALTPDGLDTLAAAEERGLLTVAPEQVAFRHELTRRAVLDTLPTARRATLHAAALAALEATADPDPAQLVHHAVAAGEPAAVVRHAPTAARAAATRHAHRAAVVFYERALEHAEEYDAAERAALLEGFAVESYFAGADTTAALAAQRRAVEMWRALADVRHLGIALGWLARVAWLAGDRPAALAAADEAVTVLHGHDDDREYGLALSNQARIHGLGGAPGTVRLAAEAEAVGRRLRDPEVRAHALITLGLTVSPVDPDRGPRAMEEALELALAEGLTEQAARAYCALTQHHLSGGELARAHGWAGPGLEYAERTEHLMHWQYLCGLRAEIALHHGEWDEACRYARLGRGASPAVAFMATAVLAGVALRTGAPAREELERGWALAQRCDEGQRLVPAAALLCEAAFLEDDPQQRADAIARARPILDRLDSDDDVYRPELAFRLARLGASSDLGTEQLAALDSPFALQAADRWLEAAEAWEAAGYRVYAADARAHSDDVDTALDGLVRLEQLGAAGLAHAVRRDLRARGVTRLPHGPRRRTRKNVAGLTERQVDVLGLLAAGLSNVQIAEKLVISARTVDHHVSAILEKLDAQNRTEAVRHATRLGWAPDPET